MCTHTRIHIRTLSKCNLTACIKVSYVIIINLRGAEGYYSCLIQYSRGVVTA